MKKLKDAVIHLPSFEKVAGFKLPKNSMEWNEVILQQFYTENPLLSKEYQVDAIVNNIDDKVGYAKGSIVVWQDKKRINFPIIVKDWELSPFDTFVTKEGNDDVYRSSTKENIDKALEVYTVGTPTFESGIYSSVEDIKRPGHIVPKDAVMRSMPSANDGYLTFDKVSSLDWKKTASEDDIATFMNELQVSPGIAHSFNKNNPDLVSGIIDEFNSVRIIPKYQERGVFDVSHYIKRQQNEIVTDGQFFDVNMLRPVKAPSVVELRINCFPSLEEYMNSGNSIISRYTAAANGTPVKGIVVDVKRVENTISDDNSQVFISLDCKSYSIKYSYSDVNVFYGMDIPVTATEFDGVVSGIASVASDKMTTYGKYTHDDAHDKLFPKSISSIERYKQCYSSEWCECSGILCLYGANNAWEAIRLHGTFRKVIVDNREVYVGDEFALIKSNISNPIIVKSTSDPMYQSAVGNKKVILIPEFTIVMNLSLMSDITSILMTPDKKVKEMFENSGVSKIAMSIGTRGFHISGEPIEPLRKLASMPSFHQYSAEEAMTALYTMGASKEASKEILNSLVKKASSGHDNNITIYGLNSNYVDLEPKRNMEKQASIRAILKEYANSIKVNLIKEASVVQDPEAVDNVLSLNFINEDNILEYAQYTSSLRETSDKLSELLIANRLGLSDVDEQAVKKAIDGIEGVITGLNNLKLIVGQR